jgi:hypothetical protein
MKYLKTILITAVALCGTGVLSITILYVFKDSIVTTYNIARPLLLDGGGEKCIAELAAKGVKYKKLGDISSNKCPILNAVRVTGFQNTRISSPFTLSCPTASVLASWLIDIKASSIKHMGSLNCRKRRGNNIYSEHSFGLAIDISHIDGASVKNDWRKNNKNGKILHKAAASACRHFNNVLTPDSNSLHHDHYHLDTGLGYGCSLDKFVRSILRVIPPTQSHFY